MFYYVSELEEDKVYKVQAGSKKEAVRKWFRSDPTATKLSDDEIDDALDSGNLNIDVFSERDVIQLA